MIELHQTQYPGTDNKPKRAIFVGLDFGTAFTKVVIAGTSDSYAIKLRPHLRGIDAYLQPCLLGIDANGHFHLVDKVTDAAVMHNLKLALIEDPLSIEARSNAAIYLALVLQQARQHFLWEYKDILHNNQLVWHLNIGLPATTYDKRNLKDSFYAVAEIAWMLSVLNFSNYPSLNLVAKSLLNDTNNIDLIISPDEKNRLIHKDRLGILPEVQAITVSYATSQQRRDGLHLLVDVGAGTLDLNLFALVGLKNDDRYVSHHADVLPLGSVYLSRHRIKKLKNNHLTNADKSLNCYNEYNALLGRRELSSLLKLTIEDIELIDGTFLNEVGSTIYHAMANLKIKTGNSVHRWRESVLPAFLAGGGSLDEAYHGRLRLVNRDMKANGMAGLDIRPLPLPSRLKDFDVPEPDQDFHRIAVAYGLTYDLINIGDFIPTSQIPYKTTSDTEKREAYYILKEYT